MTETKSMKVSTEQEQECIDSMRDFGWEFKSSQEINVKDSHLESRGGSLYNVTTSENYVKLVFSRDTNMPHYAELKQLENTYYSTLAAQPSPISGKTAAVLFVLLIFPCVLYIISKTKQRKEWEKNMAEVALPAREKARSLLG